MIYKKKSCFYTALFNFRAAPLTFKKTGFNSRFKRGRGDDEQFQYNSGIQNAQLAEISFYQLFVVKTSIWVTYFLIIS
ncbi:hypothetical protein BKP66_10520 [Bacillus amyloliquefaciens]|uniref:Uncharacterized protein n=1 Tax=Bacillus amyloliquefaciens TaxID=1390 RepID=A0AAP7N6L6_BACAM|nr:hypothetical protein BKP66_10520 [Bacillus amyloliquefaciens]